MEIQDSYSGISKQDIDVLSEKLEMKLPNSYSQFLLCSNGGAAEKKSFFKEKYK